MKTYRLIVALTFIVPLTSLLLFFYITSNEGIKKILEVPSVVFPNVDKRYDYIADPNDYWDIDPVEKKIYFHAELMIYENIEIIDGTVVIDYPEFFTIGNKYYTINENNELILFDAKKLVQEKMFENNFLIGLSVFISLGTGFAIALLVIKKMKLLARHRRLSVLISATTFTLFFLILQMISEQVYLIFLVFTMCWLAYYIEWLVYRHKNGLPLNDQISQKVVISNE